jgi:hypothetical protein
LHSKKNSDILLNLKNIKYGEIMTDQELKDLVASLAIEQKKTDEQMRKTDEQLKKTDERLNKIASIVGGISNNQGDVAEEYFINSLKDKLRIGNLDFDYLIPNYVIKGRDIKDEYDILLVNGESVAIVEVKYKVHPNDILKLEKKIENLKKLPQYKNYKVYAGIAGFYIPDTLIEEIVKQGYFVLQRKGEIIESYTDNLKVA